MNDDETEQPVGATVLDDILLQTGYGDAAVLASKGPDTPFHSISLSQRDKDLNAKSRLSLQELEDAIHEYQSSDEDSFDDERELAILHALHARKMQEQRLLTPTDHLSNLEHIDIMDFQEKVSLASQERNIIMLILHRGSRLSDIIEQCVIVLSNKFPGVGWVSVDWSDRIKGFPQQDCPTLMCYSAGQVVSQIVAKSSLPGEKTTADILEWELASRHVLLSTLENDPRGPFRLERVGKRTHKSDSDDDDW